MLTSLLPARADNDYRGHKLALVIFGLLLVFKTAISLGSIFNGHQAAGGADGIPLDTYGPAGAQAVVSMFALIGLANVTLCAVALVVLVRYRSLIPFMFVLWLLQQLSRKLILEFLPIARTGAPPGTMINSVILGMLIVGLVLSLWKQHSRVPVTAVKA